MCEFWILTDLVILVDLAILVKLAIMLTLVIFVKLVNCCCCWVAFVNGHVAVILSNCRGPAALERGLGENLKKLPSGLVAHHSCNSSCRICWNLELTNKYYAQEVWGPLTGISQSRKDLNWKPFTEPWNCFSAWTKIKVVFYLILYIWSKYGLYILRWHYLLYLLPTKKVLLIFRQ